MRKIVYTCVTGGIDKLQDPSEVADDIEYWCYSDRPVKSQVWKHKPLIKQFDNPRRTARFHKTVGANQLPADLFIWQDGKVTFQQSHNKLFDLFNWSSNIGLISHPKRDCAYREAVQAYWFGKVDPASAKAQMATYELLNFPAHNGLYESSIVVRTRLCEEFNNAWWNEIQTHTIRDQISLPYVLWKLNVVPQVFDIKYRSTDLFNVIEHPLKDERWIPHL